MKALILFLALVPGLVRGTVTFYGTGNSGQGFTDQSGSGNDATMVGRTVFQPSTPTPAEGDQWFAQPTDQPFRQPESYVSIPPAAWNSSDGMEEFWYLPLSAEGGGQSYAIFIASNADGSTIMEISHPNVAQFFMLIKNNETFHFSLPLMVNNAKHLVREEHDSSTGIQDIFVDNVNVLHVTDYTGLVPAFVSVMGGPLDFGGYSDSTALMDALQLANDHTQSYLGPPIPPVPPKFPFDRFRFDCRRDFR